MNSKFKCDKCKCNFKKEVTLKEHKNTRHGEPNSLECEISSVSDTSQEKCIDKDVHKEGDDHK